ncbi:MAG: GntR family transcriptional regulator [Planctomycetota bacterium]|nr:GntR family transcriptional regulator [Planctomycetota bacterium]MDA1211105.1 GntR family transcriptional regulator [Planctomycetota bacterium]
MQHEPFEFSIHPSSGVPIYRQLMDQVRAFVAGGRLKPGDMLPSVRQMAAELEINMMTVSKAYAKLQAEGLIERERGQGMRISEQTDSGTLTQRREQLQPFIDQLVARGLQLGLTDDHILDQVKKHLREQRP